MEQVLEAARGSSPVRRALDVTEAAQHLGVSVSYLNRLRSTGGGPTFIKIGVRVTYRLADLEAWQDQHARRSTSDDGKEAANAGAA